MNGAERCTAGVDVDDAIRAIRKSNPRAANRGAGANGDLVGSGGGSVRRRRSTRLGAASRLRLVHDEGRAMSLMCDALADASKCADAVDAA